MVSEAAKGCEGRGTGEHGGGDKAREAPELRTPDPGERGRDWCLSQVVRGGFREGY